MILRTTLAFFVLCASLRSLIAGGPVLEAGLSIHMMPDRYDLHGGFVIILPSADHPTKTFHTAKELFAYIQAQPKSELLDIPRNGIWIYSNDPDYYTAATRNEFNALLALCAKNRVSVFIGFTTWRPALPNLRQQP